MNQYDQIVLGALNIAQATALKYKNNELHPVHLVYGLISAPRSICSKKLKKYKKVCESDISRLPTVSNASIETLRPSASFSEWMTYASSNATQNGRSEVTEGDLIKYIKKFYQALESEPLDIFAMEEEGDDVPHFLTNLNELAEQGKLDPVIGRTKEIRAVMEILGRRSKNNPVLVGSAGVGKTAIVEGLAEAIVKGKVPDVLQDKLVYSLDMGSLMAGTKFQGEFEERIQALIKFLKSEGENVILFIDEIHQLVGAGKTSGAMDAANLLKPALARGELNCIGATTDEEYQKYILNDSALDRRFRSVPVLEPSKEDSIEILIGLREKLEIHHGIKITDDAIYSSVMLSTQYITNKNLPDKAIDLIDEAASALKLSAEAMPAELVELESEIRSKKINAEFDKKNKDILKEIEELQSDFNLRKEQWEKEVFNIKRVSELKNNLDQLRFELEQAERKQDYETASKIKYSQIPTIEKELDETQHEWELKQADIAKVIARQSGIPIEKILKTEQERILELKSFLKSTVFGQDQAISEIADTLVSSHAGLSDESRPLGSFLLKGPSGVGKTETAKRLCEFLFNSTRNMIRLDMSEFSEQHSIAKLIGAPPGYIGYDEGGILTEAIRKHPYAVILLDEIEKAHYNFSDIMLQILDDGRLTDSKGRTVDFKNTIIIMTTNAEHVETSFKPEVLGRIDAVLEYNQLDSSIMIDLVAKQVEQLNSRLEDKGIHVRLSEEFTEEIATKGHDPRYGARPLHSVFNKLVIRPLSEKLLRGQLEKGEVVLTGK